jgi:hypothetical protein
MSIINRWNVLSALHNPNGIRLKANVPHSVVNVVFN